ncbi:MAG: DUF4834 family protein [Phocaeicola sp.]|uniref:DUF4834 family protein n=1 Tax=Phocaeicola sp. TaxID=2773926 RepID=UPI0023D363B6|nr:DUF4834 family protein [Phocaeicola sp.]MDE5678655.1 DUF4834 family protein [Phocaeicola sp.]MDE6181019.1 DUF4834 family protein [Phocaeicola sp.]
MFGVLVFILIPFLLIIFIGFAILSKILKIFGIGRNTFETSFGSERQEKRSTYNSYNDNFTETTYSSATSRKHSHSSNGRKKIFDDDEGEYVDYEEVK